MNILIMDMGSRLNVIGGQARFAATLQNYFLRTENAYYLGYETEYMKQGAKNAIILPRSGAINPSLRRSKLSEMSLFRAAYNLLIIRRMGALGVGRGELLEKVKAVQPDVIISNSIQDMPVLRFLKTNGLQFKTIYIDHTCISNTEFTYFSKEGIPLTLGCGVNATNTNDAKKQFFNFFDMNVALNLAQERIIKGYTDKVVRINIGVNRPKRDTAREEALRAKYGLEHGEFIVLYAGRMFERQKNASVIIDAFQRIKGDGGLLVFVGDGPSLNDYKTQADGNWRIIFTGSVSEEDLSSFYDLADVFVLPSRWEGFSRTVLEAASHGVPLVISTGAYIEDLKEESVGEIRSFSTGSVQALATALEETVRNTSYNQRAAEVSSKIAKRFDEDNMLGEYRDLVLKVLSKK